MDWTKAKDARLTELWSLTPQLSTARIAERIGVTKNAVIGRAHRIGLSRPSPLKPAGSGSAEAAKRRAARERMRAGVKITLPQFSEPKRQDPPRIYVPRVTLAPMAEPVMTEMPRLSRDPCSFPFGEPGTREFRYCDEPALWGKPYCAACCSRAYVARKPHSAATVPAETPSFLVQGR